jgi:dihydrofolate reductase
VRRVSGSDRTRTCALPRDPVTNKILEPLAHVESLQRELNSTVVAGDVVEEVSRPKEELDGEIVVAGSIRLVRTLMENDLVDELRLMIYPGSARAGTAAASSTKPVHRTRARPRTG